MVTYLAITLMLVSCVWAVEPPCRDEECRNITLYLGPRWGTKVIYPNYPKFRGPSEQEAKRINVSLDDTGKQEMQSADAVENGRRVPVIKQRPTPEDNSLSQDLIKDNAMSLNNPRLPFMFDAIILDLMHKNLTGEGLKDKLAQMSVQRLQQVRHLYLNNNNISFLPVLTFPVEMEYGVVKLSLDNNPLVYLSSYTRFELSRLGNLQILSLYNTGLYYFDSLYLPFLETLILSSNHLSSVPPALESTWTSATLHKTCEILSLYNTGLYYLDSLYLPSLETLILSSNHLSSVPPALESMPNLRHLDLSGNRITSLTVLSLSPLSQLKFLSLANNGMVHLWHDAFLSLYNLETLYLNDNQLKHAFQVHVPFDTDIYLRGNPWTCDCPLLNLVAASSPRVADKEDVTCVDAGSLSPPQPVTSLARHNLRMACVGERSVWRILEDGWSTARDYSCSYGIRWLAISVLLVCAIVLTMRVLRSIRQARAPEVPYAVLGEKSTL